MKLTAGTCVSVVLFHAAMGVTQDDTRMKTWNFYSACIYSIPHEHVELNVSYSYIFDKV